MAIDVRVYAGPDDTFIAWTSDFVAGARGFSLRRRIRRAGGTPPSPEVLTQPDAHGFIEEYVSSWVGFANGPDVPEGTRKPTSEWPIQKYLWTDYAVTAGDEVAYKVTPVLRNGAGVLVEDTGNASAWTATVTLGPRCGAIDCYFNRGIVASQWLARLLPDDGTPRSTKLRKSVDTPGDPIRDFLGGPQRAQIVRILKEVKQSGGHIYAALYELADPELITLLKDLGKRAHIVLGNGSVKKRGADQNAPARQEITPVCDVHDRMLSPDALAHNKFLVVCAPDRSAVSVWTGSMNWTETGLCSQANNSLHIHDAAIAGEYKKQWLQLKAAGDATSDTDRKANGKKRTSQTLADTTLWFTPMTGLMDLEYANERIVGAQQGILFLMFNPGPMGTLLNSIIERVSPAGSHYDPELYIQGVLNQDPSTTSTKVELFHRTARQEVNSDVVLPAAIERRLKYWVEELKKLPKTFAMVHSKVIVVDPFGARPIVMTGSHNLGPKASGTNDENFVIIENNARLAAAYASNIMAIYSQYRWRSKQPVSPTGHAWKGLADDDRWQIDNRNNPRTSWDQRRERELDFWFGRR